MEVLQSDEKLREEIIIDAKNMADRIIKKAKSDAEAIIKKNHDDLNKMKVDYENIILREAKAITDMIKASSGIEIKKIITKKTNEIIDKIFNEIENYILNDKKTYSSLILKLINEAISKINNEKFILQVSKKNIDIIGKDNILSMVKSLNKTIEIEINDSSDEFVIFSDDKKIASFISIKKYLNDLIVKERLNIYNILFKKGDN
jgi:vacuolar-type H+-ATPase subunit E/Vma4